jgi:hypothetical protein
MINLQPASRLISTPATALIGLGRSALAMSKLWLATGGDMVSSSARVFSESERLAIADYLDGYSGLTREAYRLDLRQFTGWCRTPSLALFDAAGG